MKKRLPAAVLTLLVAGLTGRANAQNQKTIFDVADTNHDGYVDLAEHNTANYKSFKKYDTNGDDALSTPEMIAKFKNEGLPQTEIARGVNANLMLMDSNKDGSLSWAEFKAWYEVHMFGAMDKNHDGMLSREEFILNEKAP